MVETFGYPFYQNSIQVTNVVNPTSKIFLFKSLGTSVINSPMSPPFIMVKRLEHFITVCYKNNCVIFKWRKSLKLCPLFYICYNYRLKTCCSLNLKKINISFNNFPPLYVVRLLNKCQSKISKHLCFTVRTLVQLSVLVRVVHHLLAQM